MRAMLLRSGAAVAALLFLGLMWLVMARHLAGLVDGVATVRVAKLSPSPFGWNDTWLQFGPPLGKVHGQMPGIDPQFRSLDLTGPGPLYRSFRRSARPVPRIMSVSPVKTRPCIRKL